MYPDSRFRVRLTDIHHADVRGDHNQVLLAKLVDPVTRTVLEEGSFGHLLQIVRKRNYRLVGGGYQPRSINPRRTAQRYVRVVEVIHGDAIAHRDHVIYAQLVEAETDVVVVSGTLQVVLDRIRDFRHVLIGDADISHVADVAAA